MAINQALSQEIKKRKEAWATFNRHVSRVESEANKLHKYTTKINGKGGYISNKNLLTAGDKLVEVLTQVKIVNQAFSDLGIILTGTPARVDSK